MQKLLPLSFLALFSACSVEPLPPVLIPEGEEKVVLAIERIAMSADPITEGKPLPTFTKYFGTGATAVYTYVWLQNVESVTGSIRVMADWHSPNDFSPPIARTTVELTPPEHIAHFSIHSEEGLAPGPYMFIAHTGTGQSLTIRREDRFFIGMTEEAAKEFMKEEEEYRRIQEEERKKREEEVKSGSGGVMNGGSEDLPPELGA